MKPRIVVGYNGAYKSGRNCKCGKVGFDKKSAQTKRNVLQKQGNQRELRIYACPISGMWHLTKLIDGYVRFNKRSKKDSSAK